MKRNDKHIQALIFDLGGVLVDLDLPAFRSALTDVLGYRRTADLLEGDRLKGIYSDLEAGRLSTDAFREEVLRHSSEGKTPEDVDRVMHALIADIAPYKVELLRKLSRSYHLYMLSNNNGISMPRCVEVLQEAGLPVQEVFEGIFLSYEMKKLKPSEEIFTETIEQIGYAPEEMLFIDDSAVNVEAAARTGLNVLHYPQGEDLEKMLEKRLEELERC